MKLPPLEVEPPSVPLVEKEVELPIVLVALMVVVDEPLAVDAPPTLVAEPAVIVLPAPVAVAPVVSIAALPGDPSDPPAQAVPARS